MKPSRAAAFLVPLLAVLLAASGPAERLVRIDRSDAALVALRSLGIDVAQELRTCWLARVGPEEVRALAGLGVPVRRIDTPARGRTYLLVRVGDANALGALRRLGRVEPVEDSTAVFWTVAGDPLRVLPPEIPRKPLSPVSLLPGLRANPASPAAGAAPLVPDPAVRELVNRIEINNMLNSVRTLQDFRTRYATTPGCRAAGDYLAGYFRALGLETSLQPFTVSGFSGRNVVAQKRGTTEPKEIVIICAHYDSTSPVASRYTNAPGADDDGSGTAGVMEAARILSGRAMDFTVRFIAFDGEELGLLGSSAYAAAARAAGESILAVVNLDMIGYPDELPEDLDAVTNRESSWLLDRIQETASTYTTLSTQKVINPGDVYSDHAPFWDVGYSAMLVIEDSDPTPPNPYYHTVNDLVSTLNPRFFEDMERASFGLTVELGQPIRAGAPATPRNPAAAVSLYTGVFSAAADVTLTWTPVAGAAGYNVYRSTTPHANASKVNATPLAVAAFADRGLAAGSDYYYTIRAVSAAGVESNPSREVDVVLATDIPLTPAAAWLGRGLRRDFR